MKRDMRVSVLQVLISICIVLFLLTGIAIAESSLYSDDIDIMSFDSNRPDTSWSLLIDDTDADGLSDDVEISLGTDPTSMDSDCDLKPDFLEVGSIVAPLDTDLDSVIDALEHAHVDSDQDGIVDELDPQSGPQFSCMHFLPFAVTASRDDEARIEVRIIGIDDSADVSVYGCCYSLMVDGILVEPGVYISIYDDGSHGDRVANDGIWTRGHLTYEPSVSRGTSSSPYQLNGIRLRFDGENLDLALSDIFTRYYPVELVALNPLDVEEPQHLTNSLQMLPHVVNITNVSHALQLAREQTNAIELSQIFYRYFSDHYDFLILVPGMVSFTGPAGQYRAVQNEVSNIGKALFNVADQFGSLGRLKGVIYIDPSYVPGGPKLHEIMHKWAVPDLGTLNIGQCTTGHWGVMGQKGQLGGFDAATLVDNGNGTYTVEYFGRVANGGDRILYSDIELYFAGFIPAQDVVPISVPRNVDCDSFTYSDDFSTVSFAAEAIDIVTIEQITTLMGGERVPNHTAAQREFSTAMVVVSTAPLTAAELTLFELDAARLGADIGNNGIRSFHEATRGTASMITEIGEPVARHWSYIPLIQE